jgi:beta-lactamase superfamily II metal-dependent hydrolase
MTYLTEDLAPHICHDGKPDRVCISIFGPGIGESILVGLPDEGWIIIDSLKNPDTKRPVTLEYLELLHKKAKDNLISTLATHWHDDHIRGMSDIIRECESTDFFMSAALNNDEFKTLAYLTSEFTPSKGMTSGVKEMFDILAALKKRIPKTKIKLASNSKCLFRSSCGLFELTSLSPSDASILTANSEFSSLIAAQKQTRKIVPSSKNLDSVALWLKTKHHNILLGADLENVASPNTGWKAVISDNTKPLGKASFVKIPHHGSQNAHNDDVWKHMVSSKSHSFVTEYSSSKLPRERDIERLKKHTSSLYQTSLSSQKKKVKRDKNVEKTIKQLNKTVKSAESKIGQILVIFDNEGDWSINLNEHAKQIF